MIKEMDLNQNPKKISYDEYYNIIKIINEIENSEFNSNIDFIII